MGNKKSKRACEAERRVEQVRNQSATGKTPKKAPTKSKATSRTQKTREETNKRVPDVYWAKIKDRYVFNNDKTDSKAHTYAIYTDDKTKENRIIQTHHLYEPYKKNMDKVNCGLYLKVKTTKHETVSGLDNSYYNKTVDGKKIDFNSAEIESIDRTPINKKLAQRIIKFANKPLK